MEWLRVRGARTHNLRAVDLDIPHRQLVVFSGVSGSGKSSLAMDTIFAEGRRRYVESLSSYARQLVGLAQPADVDLIDGLLPAIAVDQQVRSASPRSTVGTISETYDLLRLLFAQIGRMFCPICAAPLRRWSAQEMIDAVLDFPADRRIALLAPLPPCSGAELAARIDSLRLRGFVRVRIDGELLELDDLAAIRPAEQHQLDVVVDRLILRRDADDRPLVDRTRLSDSIETALALNDGTLTVLEPGATETVFSRTYRCMLHGPQWLEPLQARHFSFQHPAGACPDCGGLGVRAAELGRPSSGDDDLSPLPIEAGSRCPTCDGGRLQPALRAVRVCGSGISELVELTIDQLAEWVAAAQQENDFSARERTVAEPLLQRLTERLQLIRELGLGYLTLNRSAPTLSGGEFQRLRLAAQLGGGLSGVLYVVDEPTDGLHPADIGRIIALLTRLRDAGNSVLVVSHDPALLRSADWVVDIGPGAGVHGGELLYSGEPAGLAACARSLTAPFLRGRWPEFRRSEPRAPATQQITMIGCSHHNLAAIDVTIPLERLVVISGVSGSGKSSLILQTLYPLLAQQLQRAQRPAGACRELRGAQHLQRVIALDRSAAAGTARSNAATLTRLFDPLRQLFAATAEARARGYDAARFSFNVKGGRCEHCSGEGTVQVDLQFLPDMLVVCEHCGGSRYNRETLDIRYRGVTIADLLAMTVDEALSLLAAVPAIAERLSMLADVGLGYLPLGQAAQTLSGGELQRIRLAGELARRQNGRTLYILDEPSSGLHPADTLRLLAVLQRLVDAGNSVVVIEHDLALTAAADWVIDLGPGAGPAGGRVVAAGTPTEIAACHDSLTGRALAEWLGGLDVTG
jgi:excinuclease ABC subunit A